MADKDLFLFRLSWGNPYRDPPAGKPAVLAEICSTERHPAPTVFIEACSGLHELGDGYVVSFQRLSPRRRSREWSKERKGAYRRKRLENRIRKKYPLLADSIIEEETASRPGYFQGEPVSQSTEDARESALREADSLYRHFSQNAGVLFVYQAEQEIT